MAYIITNECINCGECLVYCAEDAIYDDGQFYAIDTNKCTECGSCIDYCPTYAIKNV